MSSGSFGRREYAQPSLLGTPGVLKGALLGDVGGLFVVRKTSVSVRLGQGQGKFEGALACLAPVGETTVHESG